MVIQHPLTRQPLFGSGYLRRDGLGHGLTLCVVPSGGRPYDWAASGKRGYGDANPTRGSTIHGMHARSGGADVFTPAQSLDCEFLSGPWSIATFFNIVGTGNETVWARNAHPSESTNSGWEIRVDSSNTFVFASYANNGAVFYVLSSTTVPAAGNWVVVGTSDGITRRIYVNGRQEATTTNNPNPLTTNGGVVMGAGSGSVPALYFGAAWNRCLDASEVWDLQQNPWRMFVTPGWVVGRRQVSTWDYQLPDPVYPTWRAQAYGQGVGGTT